MARKGTLPGLFLALSSVVTAQMLPDATQLEAWQLFNQQHDGKVFIRWHVETGTAKGINGGLGSLAYD